MSKKILHLQIPLMEQATSTIRDYFAISPETMARFSTMAKNKLGEEWEIIVSPCNPTISEDGQTFYNFKMEQLSKEDLVKLITT
jgi:hypothetical protein